MDNLAADFIINLNNPIEAEFEIGETEHFDCSFELFASGTVWGSIDGDISNQTDLKNALDSKADITTVNELSGDLSNLTTTVNNNYTELDGRITQNHNEITSLSQTLQSYGDIVTYDAADFATAAQGVLANTALQPGDNISELVNNAGYITSADLPTLEDLTTQAQMNAINSGATSVNIAQIASNTQAISTETLNRQNADNGLQSQIDAIVASSDVFDIVGTYAELQAYDISTVPLNDIIKVLVDSTHNNAATYYRCIETNNVKSWSYIGSEGAYYTKSEADGRFVPLTRTINGKALSNNITLDATDVGALPSSTVIPTVNNGTLTIQVNGTSVGTFTANQSGNTTANIVVPDSATWGNITGDIADQTDLQDALDEKQDKLTAGTDLEIVQGSILPNTYTQLTSITSTGTQWINSGIKLTNNFKSIIVGRLTGTPTTNFRTILGANNNNLSQGKQNVLLGWGNSANGFYAEPCIMPSYTYSSYTWDTNTHTFTTNVTSAVTTLDIDGVVDTISSAPSITGINLAIFARLAQNGTVGSQVNFELNSIELYQSGSLVFKGVPAKRNSDDEVGLYDTVSGSFFSNSGTGDFVAGSEVPAITVINFTNETGYITGINSTDVTTALGYTPVNPSSLATVATSGDYDDLTNKPTIPTVGNGTITITQGGVTKGTFTTNQSGNATIALDAGGGSSGVFIAEYEVTTFAEVQTAVNADKIVMVNYNSEEYILSGAVWEDEVTISCYTFSAFSTDAYPSDHTLKCISLFSDDEWGVILNLKLATTNTAQNIISRKTFIGEKAIYFKQLLNTDKLGFTLYNSSNTELGAFEWRPSTIGNGALLNINVPYSSSNYVGFRYWGTAVNIIAPKVATAGNYYIPTHITDGNTTVTANSSGTVNISSLLPNVSGYLENTATGTDSLTILGTATTNDYAMNIGIGSSVTDDDSIAIGQGANVSGADSLGIGRDVDVSGDNSIQLGNGTLTDDNIFQVWNYPLLDYPNGEIFAARIPSSIARTSQIPAAISDLTDDTATTPIDKAESVVDNNSGSLNFWSGTKAQYDAIVTKDANTLYNITDDTNPTLSMLELLYPVGSIYIGTMSACPLQTLGVGTWQLVAADKVLQGAGTRGDVGDTINESLPNHQHVETFVFSEGLRPLASVYGATSTSGNTKSIGENITHTSNDSVDKALTYSANNATYQDNAPVQQDAYVVNIWERIL